MIINTGDLFKVYLRGGRVEAGEVTRKNKKTFVVRLYSTQQKFTFYYPVLSCAHGYGHKLEARKV